MTIADSMNDAAHEPLTPAIFAHNDYHSKKVSNPDNVPALFWPFVTTEHM